jgi:hypothetical protein
VAGEKIVSICERGDRMLEEEIGKVYKGKKILKGTVMIGNQAQWLICGNRLLAPHNGLAELAYYSIHPSSYGNCRCAS